MEEIDRRVLIASLSLIGIVDTKRLIALPPPSIPSSTLPGGGRGCLRHMKRGCEQEEDPGVDVHNLGAAAKRACVQWVRSAKRKLEHTGWSEPATNAAGAQSLAAAILPALPLPEAKRHAVSSPDFVKGYAMGFDAGKRSGREAGEADAFAEVEAQLPLKLAQYCVNVAEALRVGYDNQLRTLVQELTSGRAPTTFVF